MKRIVLILSLVLISVSAFTQRNYGGYLIVKDSIVTDTLKANDYVGTWKGLDTNEVSGGGDSYWTKDGNYLYNLDDSVGVGTSTPVEKFEVGGTSKFNDNIFIKGFYDDGEFLELSGGYYEGANFKFDRYRFKPTNTSDYTFEMYVDTVSNESGTFIGNIFPSGEIMKENRLVVSGNSYFSDTLKVKNYFSVNPDTTHVNNTLKVDSILNNEISLESFKFRGDYTDIKSSSTLWINTGNEGNSLRMTGSSYNDELNTIASFSYDTTAKKTQFIVNDISPLFTNVLDYPSFYLNGTSYFADTVHVEGYFRVNLSDNEFIVDTDTTHVNNTLKMDSVMILQPSESLITSPEVGTMQMVDDTLRVYTNNGWEKAW